MGTGPKHGTTSAVHQNPALSKRRADLFGGPEQRLDSEPYDIGFNLGRVESQAGCIGNGVGNDFGIAMVVRQPLDVMLDGIKCRGCDDAGLAHTAAKEFANSPRSDDKIARTGKRRPDRRSETLAEANR